MERRITGLVDVFVASSRGRLQKRSSTVAPFNQKPSFRDTHLRALVELVAERTCSAKRDELLTQFFSLFACSGAQRAL
jgi:hypothetical protein